MKKLIKSLVVLLAVGMLAVSCSQPADSTSSSNSSLTDGKTELTASDFEGDTSWAIGTWKVTEAKMEVFFGEGCPYTDEQKKSVREAAEAQNKPTLDSMKGQELQITAANKDGTLRTFKEQLGPNRKFYTNKNKTEFLRATITENAEAKTTAKLVIVYTKQ